LFYLNPAAIVLLSYLFIFLLLSDPHFFSFIVILCFTFNQSCWMCSCWKTSFCVFHCPSISLASFVIEKKHTIGSSLEPESLTCFSEMLNTHTSPSLNVMSFITFQVLAQFCKMLFLPVSLHHNTSAPLFFVLFCFVFLIPCYLLYLCIPFQFNLAFSFDVFCKEILKCFYHSFNFFRHSPFYFHQAEHSHF